MGDEDHHPHEQSSEQRYAEQVHVSACWIPDRRHRRNCQPNSGTQQRRQRHPEARQLPQCGGSVAAPCQGEHHARGKIQIAVHAGERCGQHHKIHQVSGGRNPHETKHGDERAGGDVRARLDALPRHHADQHHHRRQVEEDEAEHHRLHGARNSLVRLLRFARGDGHDLGPDIAEDHETHRHPHPGGAVGKETARGEITQARMGLAGNQPEQDDSAKPDERQDRDHLDHCEPVFELAEVAHPGGVQAEAHGGHHGITRRR